MTLSKARSAPNDPLGKNSSPVMGSAQEPPVSVFTMLTCTSQHAMSHSCVVPGMGQSQGLYVRHKGDGGN